MSQTKPLGSLLASLVLLVLYVHARGEPEDPFEVSYNDRFGPDARSADEGIRGLWPDDYDDEEDSEEQNFFKYDDDFPVLQSFSDDVDDVDPMESSPFDEDYADEEESDEYDDEADDYPVRRPPVMQRYGGGPRYRSPYGGYRSRYVDDDDDDDDDYYSRSRRRYPFRRYDSDSDDDNYYSREWRRRYGKLVGGGGKLVGGGGKYLRRKDGLIGIGGYRGPDDRYSGNGGYRSSRRRNNYEDGRGGQRGGSRYGNKDGYGKRRSYSYWASKKGTKSEDSEVPDLKEVADRVRKLLGRLRTGDDKKEAGPSEVVNAM